MFHYIVHVQMYFGCTLYTDQGFIQRGGKGDGSITPSRFQAKFIQQHLSYKPSGAPEVTRSNLREP